jgi:hypothetical protein
MQDAFGTRILLGGVFSVAGLVFILARERIKGLFDAHLRYHARSMWTGEYTRGGLRLIRTAIIVMGVLLFIYGLLIIFRFVN